MLPKFPNVVYCYCSKKSANVGTIVVNVEILLLLFKQCSNLFDYEGRGGRRREGGGAETCTYSFETAFCSLSFVLSPPQRFHLFDTSAHKNGRPTCTVPCGVFVGSACSTCPRTA